MPAAILSAILSTAGTRRIKQALSFKADSWEATGSMAQLEWERCKAKLGYIVPNAQ